MINKLFFIFIIVQISYSQFYDVKAKVDLRQLRDNDKYIFDGFPEKIKDYFETTEFDQHLDYLNISIKIQFIIESVMQKGNDLVVTTQIIASNNSDQSYYSKSSEFTYKKGKSFQYSNIFDSASSLINYFAFLFIANELDTYELMGGNLFYNRSIEIADNGIQSNYSSGWDERKRKAEKNKDKVELRTLRFNFFSAFDQMQKEEIDKNYIISYMQKFYIDLLDINNNYGRDRSTIQFISAFLHQICKLCKYSEMHEILIFLTDFDKNNKEIYKSYLNS
tara:strand:- start:1500 stop:2333 length:834 start_codon:yes stop_codon:yes gene_type:complete